MNYDDINWEESYNYPSYAYSNDVSVPVDKLNKILDDVEKLEDLLKKRETKTEALRKMIEDCGPLEIRWDIKQEILKKLGEIK